MTSGTAVRSGELVRLEIPAQPAFVGVARTVVTAVASSVDGIDEDRLEDLRIAVSEACTNAVESSRATSSEERVVLRCLLDPDVLEVRIEDSGRGLALDDADDPGWGLQLIRALVDDVAFDAGGPGSAVRLLVHRSEDAGD